jgi:membrane dipeptidase
MPDTYNERMVIIDAHLDLSWNALGWNRDLDQTVAEIRLSEAGMGEKGRGTNTVAFPDMRRGRIGIALATVLARCNPRGKSSIDFRTQEIASATAQGQLAYYRLLERRGVCRMLTDWPSLETSFSEWNSGRTDAPFGFILSMEGADPIVSPPHAIDWYQAGLRVVGLAHYGPSAYAHGTGSPGGLTQAGRELLRVMEDLNLVLDMTHLADESFWQAADHFKGPVLASHNNCRAIVPGDRQFDDAQIRLIIERDGIIGAPFDAWMIVPGWKHGVQGQLRPSLDSSVRHIDHICQLAGNTKHVAIGSDLDGGYGAEQCPQEIDTIADLHNLKPLLQQHGYTQNDIEGIFHRNWLRFFERVWKGHRTSPPSSVGG